jgi:hypothetical protein
MSCMGGGFFLLFALGRFAVSSARGRRLFSVWPPTYVIAHNT